MNPYNGIDVSVVIPLLNEEATLESLYSQIATTMSNLNLRYEVIFVDDGSTDDSFDVLQDLHKKRDNITVIQFRRNFGKAAGLTAGFREAKGNVVITMDADLQDDPKEIPRFLQKLDDGYDLVSGWKKKRHDPIAKTLPSKLFNKVTSLLTRIQIHDFNCGFKAYRRDIAQEINIYGELHRYIPVLAHRRGYRVGEIVVEHHPREHGTSKYGFTRLVKGLMDLGTVLFLTGYAKRPLHVFGTVGGFLALIGFGINAYLSVLWFSGERIGHRPLLTLGVLMMIVGVQFVSMGLLGEMVTAGQAGDDEGYSIRKILRGKRYDEAE